MYLLAMMSSQKLASLHPEEVSSGYRLAKKFKIQCGGTSLVPIVLVLLSCCTSVLCTILETCALVFAVQLCIGKVGRVESEGCRKTNATSLPNILHLATSLLVSQSTSLPHILYQSAHQTASLLVFLICSNTLPLDTSLLIHKFSLYILLASILANIFPYSFSSSISMMLCYLKQHCTSREVQLSEFGNVSSSPPLS